MSYHSIHLRFPAAPPFDRENWFETFVGIFVKPILKSGMVDQYWFTRYGDNRTREIRFRLTTEDYTKLQPIIQEQIASSSFTDLDDEPNETLASNLGGSRFLSPDAADHSSVQRAQLMLNVLHSLAALFVESLIGPDIEGRFRQEKNTDPNNPGGSVFETIHHLLCNTTEVVTEVEVLRDGKELHVLSPLYASYVKADFRARGKSLTAEAKVRVRF